MIPFYIFRKGVISPVASIYHSNLLDDVDYWGYKDRMEIIEGIRKYGRRYALVWVLTLTSAILLGALIGWLLCLALNIQPSPPDYMGIALALLLAYLLPVGAIEHITNQYAEALDLIGGKVNE